MLTFIFRSTCCPGVFWVFQFLGRTFQLKVLPFGLKVFPWVFTRVVATLVGHLRQLGLRLFYFLDVWLLVAESRDLLEFLLRTTLLWSRDLGFLVNWGKVFPSLHRDFLFILGLISTSQGCWLGLQSSEFWLFRSVSGSLQGSFGARPSFGRNFSATLPASWTLSPTAGC